MYIITFNFSIYHLSSIFWCKHYMIFAIPLCMAKLLLSILYTSFVFIWLANPYIFYNRRLFFSTHRHSLFGTTCKTGGILYTIKSVIKNLSHFFNYFKSSISFLIFSSILKIIFLNSSSSFPVGSSNCQLS